MCQHVLAARPQDRERPGAFRVAIASASGGPLRNDDASRLVPHRTLAVICDGPTEHRGHRLASQLAAFTFADTVLRESQASGIALMEAAIGATDRMVAGAALVQGKGSMMRTSLVAAFPHGEQVIVGAVGSGQAVLVSHGGEQTRVTHTDLHTSPDCLIGSATAIPSVAAIRPRPDQVLVLSSGGLAPLVADGTLANMAMWHYRRGDLVNLAEHLVDAAVHRHDGETDGSGQAITVVVAGLLNAAPGRDMLPKRRLALVSSGTSGRSSASKGTEA